MIRIVNRKIKIVDATIKIVDVTNKFTEILENNKSNEEVVECNNRVVIYVESKHVLRNVMNKYKVIFTLIGTFTQ